MEFNAQMRDVLKHTINGTLGENFCIVCLDPLEGPYENIFTRICKENFEFSVADVLNEVCNIQVTESNSSVCYNCFTEASISYKFYLQSKSTEEILNHYVTELNDHVSEIDINTFKSGNELICICLTSCTPKTMKFDYNINNISKIEEHYQKIHKEHNVKSDYEKIETLTSDNVIVLINDTGDAEFYRLDQNGCFVVLENEACDRYKDMFDFTKNLSPKKKQNIDDKKYIPKKRPYIVRKKRKPRLPKAYTVCSRCPIKYRFASKLKEHMKIAHNIDLFVCQVCKALIEDEREFGRHVRTHTNIYVCNACSVVFKKRSTMISHIRKHEEMETMAGRVGSHICELCGRVLPDLGSLHEHYDERHDKKYMCFYCGKAYKGKLSFETHVRKHEMLSSETVSLKWKPNEVKEESNNDIDGIHVKSENIQIKNDSDLSKKDFNCETCGRQFVDARALMWHQRLHKNEKPYVCEECGRAFVSLNRRNQHSMCSHTAPTRRCPLCPALFHLRSMVNTHIQKVHLNVHKRRNRAAKQQNVFWKTETVPIQDLSVTVQHKLLEMQTNGIEAFDWI